MIQNYNEQLGILRLILYYFSQILIHSSFIFLILFVNKHLFSTMIRFSIFLFGCSLLFFACQSRYNSSTNTTTQQDSMHQNYTPLQPYKLADIQGHRGCRGLRPENSIPAFLHAINLGVHTLELDVVVSKDGHVIVSHEPWLSHVFCKDPEGNPIAEADEKSWNIYEMDYETLKKCDCGSLPNPRFPEQQLEPVFKPSLGDVIKAVNAHTADKDIAPIRYNIEVKYVAENDGIFHPSVQEFTQRVIDTIMEYGIEDLTTFQCFDLDCLRFAKEIAPNLTLALLVYNEDGMEKNMERLGFQTPIYSPYYQWLTAEDMTFARANDIKVVPWTVNEVEEMAQMMDMGVYGIITDYPDRLIEYVDNVSELSGY